MNEDAFNLSLRKFLKTFGVTAQREIEQAVRDALASGKLTGSITSVKARATIQIDEVGLRQTIEGDIAVA
jgi:hypothetical protein